MGGRTDKQSEQIAQVLFFSPSHFTDLVQTESWDWLDPALDGRTAQSSPELGWGYGMGLYYCNG
jgi:hypothetical protein